MVQTIQKWYLDERKKTSTCWINPCFLIQSQLFFLECLWIVFVFFVELVKVRLDLTHFLCSVLLLLEEWVQKPSHESGDCNYRKSKSTRKSNIRKCIVENDECIGDRLDKYKVKKID